MRLLVGRHAPDFSAPALLSSGMIADRYHLHTAIKGSSAMLFFEPLALTMACASELAVLDRRADDFRSLHVRMLGVTLDAQHQHSIWRNIPVDNLRRLSFPLIVDVSRSICGDYGLSCGGRLAARAAFLIDCQGIVRYQAINELPLEHEIDELLGIATALNAEARDHRGSTDTADIRPDARRVSNRMGLFAEV